MKIFKKFFNPVYHSTFEFDRFVILAFLLSIPSVLLVFVFQSPLLQLIFIILSIAFFLIPTLYLLFQPSTYRLKIERYSLKLEGNSFKKIRKKEQLENEKKNAGHSLKLVFLTDIHLHEFLPYDYVEKLIKRTNELKPDVLIFGGDYIVDELTDFRLLDQLADFNAGVKLGVLGNHDYNMQGKDFRENKISAGNFRFADKLSVKLESVGIHILRNENYLIKSQNDKPELNIFGLDDLWVKRSDMTKFKPAKHNIIVTHNPRNFIEMKERSIDLVLSGHNHGGGYVKLNKYVSLHRAASLIPVKSFNYFNSGFGKYIAGVYKNKYGVKMYSSTGLGLTGLSVRINCRPEIVVIDII